LQQHHTLESVDLKNNTLGLPAVQVLAGMLASHTTLHTLGLASSLASDAEVVAIAEGLRTNESLRYLSLHQCEVGDAGMQALVSALKTNSTLVKVRGLSDVDEKVLAPYIRLNQLARGETSCTAAETQHILQECVRCGKFNVLADVLARYVGVEGSTLEYRDTDGVLLHDTVLSQPEPDHRAVAALFNAHWEVDETTAELLAGRIRTTNTNANVNANTNTAVTSSTTNTPNTITDTTTDGSTNTSIGSGVGGEGDRDGSNTSSSSTSNSSGGSDDGNESDSSSSTSTKSSRVDGEDGKLLSDSSTSATTTSTSSTTATTSTAATAATAATATTTTTTTLGTDAAFEAFRAAVVSLATAGWKLKSTEQNVLHCVLDCCRSRNLEPGPTYTLCQEILAAAPGSASEQDCTGETPPEIAGCCIQAPEVQALFMLGIVEALQRKRRQLQAAMQATEALKAEAAFAAEEAAAEAETTAVLMTAKDFELAELRAVAIAQLQSIAELKATADAAVAAATAATAAAATATTTTGIVNVTAAAAATATAVINTTNDQEWDPIAASSPKKSSTTPLPGSPATAPPSPAVAPVPCTPDGPSTDQAAGGSDGDDEQWTTPERRVDEMMAEVDIVCEEYEQAGVTYLLDRSSQKLYAVDGENEFMGKLIETGIDFYAIDSDYDEDEEGDECESDHVAGVSEDEGSPAGVHDVSIDGVVHHPRTDPPADLWAELNDSTDLSYTATTEITVVDETELDESTDSVDDGPIPASSRVGTAAAHKQHRIVPTDGGDGLGGTAGTPVRASDASNFIPKDKAVARRALQFSTDI
jgi:hypothetical protein